MESRFRGLVAALACVPAALGAAAANADDFPPVDPTELRLTAEPNAPGAPAIILLHQVDRDDAAFLENQYVRIKILTDEGRRYGDVEIDVGPSETVGAIVARTVRPDGTVVPFTGTVYDRTVLKKGGLRYATKTFTMPDVQVGSIVEYRYRRRGPSYLVFDSEWTLSGDLFTKRGRYSLRPNRDLSLAWSMPAGLPPGVRPPEKKGERIELETRDVPAFVVEDHMPPAASLRQRVVFDYAENDFDSDPAVFWKRAGKARHHALEKFLGSTRDLERAVAQIVAPGDDAAAKFRKIYERVQRVRNTTFERERTEAEEERDRASRYAKAIDVLEQGRGDAEQITWLFYGLIRAAGLPADAIAVGTRGRSFFNRNIMNDARLDTNVVRVQVDGREVYADPGARFAPPGLLPWSETMVPGLRLAPDGGTWISTPLPAAVESRVERRATFRLGDGGTLSGTVTVKYTGLEAMTRRVGLRLEDAGSRRKYLEDELAADARVGCEVRLVNEPDWDASSRELVAEYEVTIPGWAVPAGNRWLLGASVFGASERATFTAATRTHPIYFEYPYEEFDDLSIALPAGVGPETIFPPQSVSKGAVEYESRGEFTAGTLKLTRRLKVDAVLVAAQQYPVLRNFFQSVRAADEQQVVVTRGVARAAK